MKTIIAPVDFSPISLNSLNYAADFANVLKADLVIVHFYTVPVTYTEIPVQAINRDEICKDAQERIDVLKEKIIRRVNRRINITSEVIEDDVVSGIEEYCKSVKPYAIVMGAESGHAYERFLFGAKTISAMKKLEFPLVVVPPDAKFSQLSRVGLACDLKDVVETLPLQEIKDLINEFHAELHVLHVSNDVTGEFNAKKVEESGELQEMLFPLNPRYDFIQNDDVEEAILQFAEKHRLDLLIVVPKYDHMLYKILQRSHSNRLVLHAHIPVLSIHE